MNNQVFTVKKDDLGGKNPKEFVGLRAKTFIKNYLLTIWQTTAMKVKKQKAEISVVLKENLNLNKSFLKAT